MDCRVDGWDIDGKREPATHAATPVWTAKSVARSLLPRPVKTRLNVRRARSRLLSQWKASLNGTPVSAIVVGGGHLLTGTTEYFPARLNAVAELARELRVPVHVHSVGVSHPDTWEAAAGEELRRFLRDESIASVSVRDEQSADYLGAAGHSPQNIRIALDPGLLAEKTFDVGRRPQRQKLRIGLGIMSPRVVSSVRNVPSGITDRFWIETARRLVASGADVGLFTTGEVGDIRVARRLAAQLTDSNVAFDDIAVTPKDDADLVNHIAGFDAIVAQRLHASIISYALGIPSVGLGWEPKVRAFYRLSGRVDYFIDDRDARPADISARIVQAARDGLDTDLRDRNIEACNNGIRSLANLISKGG